MFKSNEKVAAERARKEAGNTSRNYVISRNDKLTLQVSSNKGERIIDPNPDLSQNALPKESTETTSTVVYLVDINGLVKIPMIGEIKLEGLTIKQAEEILQKEYATYFKEPYVRLDFANKRVIVLGAVGGHVIPLTDENITLVEVLALAKGLNNDSKASNIRLLRADRVFEIDFSTIEGFRDGNMLIEPGDIVYVEPVRRPFSEGLRDNSGLVSLLIAMATLLTVVNNLR
jgi:polysaccharide biosynthesis/export protein